MIVRHRSSQLRGGRAAATCPVCQQADRVEKASSVIGQNSGTVYVAPTGMPHRFTTALALSLSMPSRPSARSWPRAVFLAAASMAVAGLVLAAAFALEDYAGVSGRGFSLGISVLVIMFGVVLPLWTMVRTWEQHRMVARRIVPWQRAVERWNRLYYCFRDDAAFLKGEPNFEPPVAVERLLFTAPERAAATVPAPAPLSVPTAAEPAVEPVAGGGGGG